jgi:uncharacterized lipoprotein YajG
MHRKLLATMLLAGALVAAGCDNEIENATTPAPPAPTTSDTFSGTINVNGAQTHTFAVVASGSVTVTLTEVLPDSTIAVGLMLGTWNGTACATVIANDNTLQGNAVIGLVSGAGVLCARIHDVGKLTGPLEYKLTVVHP